MDARNISLIVVGLLGGIIIGYGYGFTVYESQIKHLQNDVENINSVVFSLNQSHVDLLSEKSKIEKRLDTLQLDYDELDYDYSKVLRYLTDLTQHIYTLDNELGHYYDLEDSFSVVLNWEEVSAIGSKVEEVTYQSQDSWKSYERIHNYIIGNISYSSDLKLPYISDYEYEILNDENVIVGFEVGSIENYISAPNFTLNNKMGDCDDQAVLEYAMIQYYREEVLGKIDTLYLASINFTDGNSHLAVFMPVENDKICILDPVGDYLTSYYVGITSTPVESEIYNYQSHWGKDIEEITLYDVNINYGSYVQAFRGSIDLLIYYLKE
jgi:hypothetical protein